MPTEAYLAILLACVAGAVLAPGTSHAGGGTDATRNFSTWSTGDGGFRAFMTPDWKLGDCTLVSTINPDNTIVTLTPLEGNRTSVIWHGIGKTSHTNNGDIWWVTFHFRTAFGTEIVTSPRLRSTTMRDTNRTYIWDDSAYFLVDAQVFPLIASVDWESTC